MTSHPTLGMLFFFLWLVQSKILTCKNGGQAVFVGQLVNLEAGVVQQITQRGLLTRRALN